MSDQAMPFDIAHDLLLKETIYQCKPDIEWVRDRDVVLVVDAEKGLFWHLGGVEAMVWDWLVLGYSNEKMERFLELALEKQAPHVAAILGRWEELGILQVSGDHPRGKPGDQHFM